jgi:hypothetical protein
VRVAVVNAFDRMPVIQETWHHLQLPKLTPPPQSHASCPPTNWQHNYAPSFHHLPTHHPSRQLTWHHTPIVHHATAHHVTTCPQSARRRARQRAPGWRRCTSGPRCAARWPPPPPPPAPGQRPRTPAAARCRPAPATHAGRRSSCGAVREQNGQHRRVTLCASQGYSYCRYHAGQDVRSQVSESRSYQCLGDNPATKKDDAR